MDQTITIRATGKSLLFCQTREEKAFKKNDKLFLLKSNFVNSHKIIFLDNFNITKFESTQNLVASSDEDSFNAFSASSNNKPTISSKSLNSFENEVSKFLF